MYNSPCKDCKDRCVEPNCHTTCSGYLEFKAKIAAVREKELAFKNECKPLINKDYKSDWT